ncbi:hypothetical protein Hsw_3443 [Hymenobacter swuensis DY53]|uniref:Uncharacterized protein n=1 Tax=Hymenobacter swuensis DY53 TaxID=1227739 RepID=W8F288_9BACT|nr:hypothetical protein Hsw_3443 [Hymenobacter swuensis DY53]
MLTGDIRETHLARHKLNNETHQEIESYLCKHKQKELPYTS